MTSWRAQSSRPTAQGHYEIYDQSYRQVAQVHAGNGYQGDLHEFLLTDPGPHCSPRTAGDGDLRRAEARPRGPYFYGVVQEVDVASGRVLFQWRSESTSPSRPPTRGTREPRAIRGIVPHQLRSRSIPTDQNLIISSRNTWAFYKVDRKTGGRIWKCGGRGSELRDGPRDGTSPSSTTSSRTPGDGDDLRQRGRTAEGGQAVPRAGVTRRRAGAARPLCSQSTTTCPPVMSEPSGRVQPLERRQRVRRLGNLELLSPNTAARGSGAVRWAPGRPERRPIGRSKATWNRRGQTGLPGCPRGSRAGSSAHVYK